MGLFDVTDEKLQAFYHGAWLEADRGVWIPESIHTWIKRFLSMPGIIIVHMTKLKYSQKPAKRWEDSRSRRKPHC